MHSRGRSTHLLHRKQLTSALVEPQIYCPIGPFAEHTAPPPLHALSMSIGRAIKRRWRRSLWGTIDEGEDVTGKHDEG